MNLALLIPSFDGNMARISEGIVSQVAAMLLSPFLHVLLVMAVDTTPGPHDVRHFLQKDSVISLHAGETLAFHLVRGSYIIIAGLFLLVTLGSGCSISPIKRVLSIVTS